MIRTRGLKLIFESLCVIQLIKTRLENMNEYRLIFDYLFSEGLTPENLDSKIHSLSPEDIYRITLKLIKYTSFDKVKVNSHFNFMSNSRLSGGQYLDSTFESRLINCDSLIRDSLLFADTIWIKNPIDSYFHCDPEYFCYADTRNELITDIIILYKYRSLLESGLARICGTEVHFCYDCLLSSISYDDVPSKYRRLVNQIENHICNTFKDEIKFFAYKENDRFYLRVESNRSDLLEQKENMIELTEYGFGPILRNASKRKSKKVFKKEVKDSTTLYCELMRPIIDDILMFNWFSNQSRNLLSYFTNRELDAEMMNKLNSNRTKHMNIGLANALAHSLPTILQVPTDRILELRQNEPEAFQNYRHSLNKLLTKVRAKELSDNEAKEALNDTVLPSINQMNIAVKNNREKAGRGLLVNAVFAVGSMVLGLADGILPGNMKGPLMALGVSNHGASAIHNLRTILSNDSSQREQQFYFLWKLTR